MTKDFPKGLSYVKEDSGSQRPGYGQAKAVFPSGKALTGRQLGASWRTVILCLPRVFANGLQVIS